MEDVMTRMVHLSEILVGENDVRTVEDDPELLGLAESIAVDGLINPLTVEEREKQLYLVAGHRRYAACVLARVVQVPVVIRPAGKVASKRVSFAENFHRRDLSPWEQAVAIGDVLSDETMTAEEVASCFHRSVDWVRGQLLMLSWPEDVVREVQARRLNVTAAANLARVEDADYRGFLLATAIENGATAATTAIWLQGWRSMRPAAAVVSDSASDKSAGARMVPPQSLCMGCREAFTPDGLVPVYVCPGCVAILRRQGLSGA